LAAALAAGETPSPELVAEAGAVGGLPPHIAGTVLSAIVAITIGVVLLSGRTQLQRLTPLDKSPEVLAERAKTLVAALGYADAGADSASGFHADGDQLSYVLEHDRSARRWDRLSVGRPAAIQFWYRQGAPDLVPVDRMSSDPTFDDPSPANPGMITLFLDPRGRLERFQAVPPEREGADGEAREPDWPILLKEAGLEASSLRTVSPQWIPPTLADRRAAWEGAFPEAPDLPIRIEAAAYRGRPVSFRIVYPWTHPAGAPSKASSVFGRVSTAIGTSLVAAVLVGAVFLARRNVRLGRGDRKGALRIAAVVFSVGWIAILLAGHYVASFDEVGRIVLLTAFPLVIAVLVFIFYLGLEPHLRRLWPRMIVSWVRLLDGRFTDPLVGRDILIGVLWGVGNRLLDQGYQLSAEALGSAVQISDVNGGPPIDQTLVGLVSARHALSNLVAFVGAALLLNLGYIVFLLLCRVVSRRTGLAVAIFLLTTVTAAFPAGGDWRLFVVYALALGGANLVGLFRFGLLTLVVGQFVVLVLTCFPLTLHASAWYSGRTVLALAVVGALAVYGFRVASTTRRSARGVLASGGLQR
jgi:serine/threonine-protein kinase